VGPEWYSFQHGRRHFLVIENNGAAPFDEQLAWIERDLAEHAEGMRVVVLMHQPMNVPFGSPSSYDAYEEVLERYDTELVLIGHEHSNDVDERFVAGAKHI
jgi:predicted phosphohydrolase